MKVAGRILFAAVFAVLAGCAALMPPPVSVGDSEADLIAKRGQPTNRYQDGNDRVLEYNLGPWSQKTYMARIGSDNRVISFEQVLTTEKFATLKLDQSTKNDVLFTVGNPTETSYLSLSDLEVWTYPYRRDGMWNSLMHVHFDKAGIVRKMLHTPDPRFEPPPLRSPFGFGMPP